MYAGWIHHDTQLYSIECHHLDNEEEIRVPERLSYRYYGLSMCLSAVLITSPVTFLRVIRLDVPRRLQILSVFIFRNSRKYERILEPVPEFHRFFEKSLLTCLHARVSGTPRWSLTPPSIAVEGDSGWKTADIQPQKSNHRQQSRQSSALRLCVHFIQSVQLQFRLSAVTEKQKYHELHQAHRNQAQGYPGGGLFR